MPPKCRKAKAIRSSQFFASRWYLCGTLCSSRTYINYEIRDIMNRSVHPDINLDFEIRYITRKELCWSQPTYNPLLQVAPPPQPQVVPVKQLVLNCFPTNKGQVVAEHVHYFIHLPVSILAPGQEFDITAVKDGYDILEGSTVNDVRYAEISWTLHADGAPMKKGKIRLRDVGRR